MSNTALAKTETKGVMEYVPHGAADKIKLSIEMVKNLIAVPTKSGKTCTDRDAIKFMAMCQAKRLNPYEGDAYLVGYDSGGTAVFSLITAHQAFLKRAEVNADYDGMLSGIIVEEEDGQIHEIEGDFYLPTQKVLGGWAKVFHKHRTHPTYRKIRLERFNSGYAQWKEDAAGMICKCAEADALRSTFPTMLGGLYMQGEINVETRVTSDLPTNKMIEFAPQPTVEAKPRQDDTQDVSLQQQLADIVLGGGHDFDTFKKWASEMGHVKEESCFDEIPTPVAKRLILARVGLLKALADLKGGTK